MLDDHFKNRKKKFQKRVGQEKRDDWIIVMIRIRVGRAVESENYGIFSKIGPDFLNFFLTSSLNFILSKEKVCHMFEVLIFC